MKHIIYSLVLLGSFFLPTATFSQLIKVTLLGTGTPQPSIERFGPATLIEAGGQYFLFDCGRGATQRLWQQKVQLGRVTNLFLTHLHSDHTVGIPDLWLTGWIGAAYGQRKTPFEVWGPAGTAEMMHGLETAYSWDVKARSEEKNKTDSGVMVNTHTITEGIVYEKEGIKITAFLVDHSDFIDSALGYRFDYKGHSVVVSGDTRYSENLIKHAKDVDVLIHEVIVVRQELLAKSPLARQIINLHTTPEQAGKIFSLTKPKLAVYSHIAMPLIDLSIPPPTANDLILQTRKTYAGRLEVGEDLMVIDIGDAVQVTHTKNKL
jgi:ribonuclease Z